MLVLLSFFTLFLNSILAASDPGGYIVYCPCMGRFGNQADHFLGSLSFAKKLNRTLVVPPWITHDYTSKKYGNGFVPYKEWFDLETVKRYHRVIGMDEFMQTLAPTLWPLAKRQVYCHKLAMERSDDKQTCPAKHGNPFGPFWNNFDIDFASSKPFPPGVSYYSSKQTWDEAFPPDQHYVLALMGAPAAYPVRESDKRLQTYVEWSKSMSNFSTSYISQHVKRPFVGIHLRNGIDWARACEHVGKGIFEPFMSSPQCVGYSRPTSIEFTRDMCFPSRDTIRKQVIEAVKSIEAKTLFIATDADSMKQDFKKWFAESSLPVQVVKLKEDSLVSDLSILIESDLFIGSCASSVTAFVVRKREILDRQNRFFGVFNKKSKRSEL